MRIDGCNVNTGSWIVASIKDPRDGRVFGLMGKVIIVEDDDVEGAYIGVKVYRSRDCIKVERKDVQRLDVVVRPLPTTEEVEERALEHLIALFN